MQTGKYHIKFFIPGVICLLTIATFSFSSAVFATNEHSQKTEKAPALLKEADNTLSGKVLETMDAKNYTYVLLKNGSTETWLAAPLMKVTVGEELEFQQGIEMKKFHSTEFNRTFETIFFSEGLISAKGPSDEAIISMAHSKRRTEQTTGTNEETAKQQNTLDKNRQMDKEIIQNAHGGKTLASLESGNAPVLDTLAKPIEKASSPDGYRISEIYEKQAELVGKEVAVRGRVVKIAVGILGMNWMHLQDGSGDISSGTYDLTITSRDQPNIAVDDIITMRGTVHLNKDFGAGYKYALILMEGKKQ